MGSSGKGRGVVVRPSSSMHPVDFITGIPFMGKPIKAEDIIGVQPMQALPPPPVWRQLLMFHRELPQDAPPYKASCGLHRRHWLYCDDCVGAEERAVERTPGERRQGGPMDGGY